MTRALPILAVLVLAIAPTAMAAGDDEKITLGIVLFDGFELLDVMGPLEMFGNVGRRLEIVMVAEKKGEIVSAQHVKTVADYSFRNCPDLDVILVPGGGGVRSFSQNETAMSWLKERAAKAELVASVCTGAAILAEAGLLNGYKATTNKMAFGMVSARGPETEWIHEARWVEDRDRMTSSGVSAGIDMSLRMIERLFDSKTAERIANGTEYEWHRDPTWDPFAKLYQKKQ